MFYDYYGVAVIKVSTMIALIVTALVAATGGFYVGAAHVLACSN